MFFLIGWHSPLSTLPHKKKVTIQRANITRSKKIGNKGVLQNKQPCKTLCFQIASSKLQRCLLMWSHQVFRTKSHSWWFWELHQPRGYRGNHERERDGAMVFIVTNPGALWCATKQLLIFQGPLRNKLISCIDSAGVVTGLGFPHGSSGIRNDTPCPAIGHCQYAPTPPWGKILPQKTPRNSVWN